MPSAAPLRPDRWSVPPNASGAGHPFACGGSTGRPAKLEGWAGFGLVAGLVVGLVALGASGPASAAYLGQDGRTEWLGAEALTPASGDAPASAASGASAQQSEAPAVSAHRKGMAALAQGERSQARALFQAALAADPKYSPAHIGMASIEIGQNNPAGARRFLEEAERVDPQSAAVALAWGRLYLLQGLTRQAEPRLQRATELAPRAVVPWVELGQFYLRQPKRAADALTALQKAVQLAPQHLPAQLGLAAAQAANGQRPAAFKTLAAVTQAQPGDPAAWLMTARLHLASGQPPAALKTLEAGLDRNPKALALMLERTRVLAGLRRWSDALAQLDAVAQVAPKLGLEQLLRGDILLAQARHGEAETAYRQALSREPGNAMALNNLAWLLLQGSPARPQEAVKLAGKAVALAPQAATFFDTLGQAQHAAGQHDAAALSLAQAIHLQPEVGSYHLHLAVVADARGQVPAMRAALGQAFKLDPALRQSPLAKPLLAKAPGL